ncbi:MAG: protein kinase [Bdellovibrionales bacterium]|nr:protein kinase [Bdellovibrionales bacterium]
MARIIEKTGVYKIENQVGEGITARIYAGSSLDNRYNDIKRVIFKIAKSAQFVSILRGEYQKLDRIKSNNVVRALDWELIDGFPAIVMERVDGLSLHEVMTSNELSMDQISYIICEIKKGLDDIHSFGLCHGDLSPKNVMIDRSGRIKLIDLGCGSEKEHFLLGTRKYLSKSRLSGLAPSKEDDWYSYNQIAFELKQINGHEKTEVAAELEVGKIQKELEKKISFLLRNRGNDFMSTQMIARRVKKTSNLVALMLLLFASITMGGDVSGASGDATVIVSSKKWVQIKIDGQEVGYSPLSIQLSSGNHQFHWSTSKRSGKIALSLKPGETKFYGDNDFE